MSPTKAQGKVADCAIVRQSPVGMQKKYTQPGSNWRPSVCEADVTATRPWVGAAGARLLHSFPFLFCRDFTPQVKTIDILGDAVGNPCKSIQPLVAVKTLPW